MISYSGGLSSKDTRLDQRGRLVVGVFVNVNTNIFNKQGTWKYLQVYKIQYILSFWKRKGNVIKRLLQGTCKLIYRNF